MANWAEQDEDSDWMEHTRIWMGECRVWEETRPLSQERVVCFLPKMQLSWYNCRHNFFSNGRLTQTLGKAVHGSCPNFCPVPS